MTRYQNKQYDEIKKEFGEKVAKAYWKEIKTKERIEKLEKEYPMDKPVIDKGQISSQTGGVFINKKKRKESIFS